MRYTVVIQQSRYGYHVECPALPGCVSQGSSLKEALDHIKDAIKTYLIMIEKETRKRHTAEVLVNVQSMLFTDLSAERVVRALQKAGFTVIHQGKHIGMSDGFHRLTIPRHKRLNPYTLKAIVRHAGLTDQAFKDLL